VEGQEEVAVSCLVYGRKGGKFFMRRMLIALMLTLLMLCPARIAVTHSGVRVMAVTAMATEDGEQKDDWIKLACDLCDCCQWFEGFF
jgi:hypothetical protein